MFSYNLHGLLGIRSNEKLPYYRCFQVDNVNPDIEIRFGDFTPNLARHQHKGRFHVSANSVFLEGRYKVSYSKLQIDNPENHTVIRFYGDPFFSRELFFVLLLEPFLTFKLSLKDVLMLHASSISKNGEGIIIAGKTGVGKTAAALTLLDSDGTEYFSDDQCIVKDGMLYSYPMPIGLRLQLARRCGVKLGAQTDLVLARNFIINHLTAYYGNLTHRVHPDEIKFKSGRAIKVGTSAPMRKVFMLTHAKKQGVQRLGTTEAYDLLKSHNCNNEDKQKVTSAIFDAYRGLHPGFDQWRRFDWLLKCFASDPVDFYEVLVDRRVSTQKNMNQIKETLIEKN